MKVLLPGHKYRLKNFENENEAQYINFIHKELDPDSTEEGALRTVEDGTTNEEVLEMMIHRMQFLQEKFPCKANAIVITNLEESLMWLEKHTADRKKRGVEGKHLK